jgi:hypothetical protein
MKRATLLRQALGGLWGLSAALSLIEHRMKWHIITMSRPLIIRNYSSGLRHMISTKKVSSLQNWFLEKWSE